THGRRPRVEGEPPQVVADDLPKCPGEPLHAADAPVGVHVAVLDRPGLAADRHAQPIGGRDGLRAWRGLAMGPERTEIARGRGFAGLRTHEWTVPNKEPCVCKHGPQNRARASMPFVGPKEAHAIVAT